MTEHARPTPEPFEAPPRIHDIAQLDTSWKDVIPDAQTLSELLSIGIPPIYANNPQGYVEKIGNIQQFILRMNERQ